MHKGLITISLSATLVATLGCSSTGDNKDSATASDSDWTFVHKPTIQQGIVLTREMLDELHTGMSKEQVRFLLGTPPLIDIFHQDRWDYIYWLKKPDSAAVENRLSLIFVDGLLAEIKGDYTPGVEGEAEHLEEVYVDVPDNSGEKGIVTRTLEGIGLKK